MRHPVCQITRANKHVGTPALINTGGRVTSDRRISNCNQSGWFVPVVRDSSQWRDEAFLTQTGRASASRYARFEAERL